MREWDLDGIWEVARSTSIAAHKLAPPNLLVGERQSQKRGVPARWQLARGWGREFALRPTRTTWWNGVSHIYKSANGWKIHSRRVLLFAGWMTVLGKIKRRKEQKCCVMYKNDWELDKNCEQKSVKEISAPNPSLLLRHLPLYKDHDRSDDGGEEDESTEHAQSDDCTYGKWPKL